MAAAEIMDNNNVTNKMMRPPAITPNYGKKKSLLPKTNLPKVVLHDNVTQEQMLQAKLNNIKIERRRSSRMLELDRRSFIVQQSLKQEHLRTLGIHVNFIPEDVVQTHLTMSKYRTANTSPPQPAKKKVFPKLIKNDGGFITKIFENEDPQTPDAILSAQRHLLSAEEPIRRRDSAKNINRLTSTLPALRSQSAFDAPSGDWRISSVKGFATSFGMRKEKTFAHRGEYSRSVSGIKDPRFVLLQNVLIPSDRPSDGFIQLSPCGREVLDRYKRNIAGGQRGHAGSRTGSSSTHRPSALQSVKVLPSSLAHRTKSEEDHDSESDAESVAQ